MQGVSNVAKEVLFFYSEPIQNSARGGRGESRRGGGENAHASSSPPPLGTSPLPPLQSHFESSGLRVSGRIETGGRWWNKGLLVLYILATR